MRQENDSSRIRVLIDEEELQQRIRELAKEIDRDYRTLSPLLCVGILKGSVFFLTALARATCPTSYASQPSP